MEILVYLVPAHRDSVVRKAGCSDKLGKDGTTFSGPMGMISEVYYKNFYKPRHVADMAFHEFMHNKLKMSDGQLHKLPGVSLGKDLHNTGYFPTKISAYDIQLMGPSLLMPVPQDARF